MSAPRPSNNATTPRADPMTADAAACRQPHRRLLRAGSAPPRDALRVRPGLSILLLSVGRLAIGRTRSETCAGAAKAALAVHKKRWSAPRGRTGQETCSTADTGQETCATGA